MRTHPKQPAHTQWCKSMRHGSGQTSADWIYWQRIKPTTPSISKSPQQQCVPAKNSLHVSRPLPETTPWARSLAFSKLLPPTSVDVCYKNDSNCVLEGQESWAETMSLPTILNAFYGHWPGTTTTTIKAAHRRTHTGQPRSRAVCFLAAVFLRVPAAAVIPGFLQSQVCVTRLGSVHRGHIIPLSWPPHSLKSGTPRIT